MTKRTWETNAGQYGEMVNETEGWYFGLLVACSVNGNSERAAAHKSVNKVSNAEFTDKAGVPRDRGTRHGTAWGRAADAGLVPQSWELEPDDVERIPLPSEAEHPWRTFYTGLSRHTAEDRLSRAANAEAGALVGQMKPKQRMAIVTEIAKRSPDAVVQAVKADPEVADELQRGAGPELFDAGNRVRAEKVFNHEAQAIANGGRIPSLDEINGPAAGEGGYNQFIPQFNKLRDAERLVDKAYTLIVEARQILPLTDEQEKQVQAMALHILESLDKEHTE